MQRPKAHPVLLIGTLSLATSALLEWLAYPALSRGFLHGFLDGLAVLCLYGSLLVSRKDGLRQSELARPSPPTPDVVREIR
jgi:hypothetical protein